MIRFPAFRLMAGACLLVAALLSLAGAAAGPAAHLRIVQQEARGGTDRGGELPDAPAPHSEEGCRLCHTLAQHPLPESGSVALPVRFGEVRSAVEPRAVAPLVFALPTRARAPPHLDPVTGGRA